MTDKPETEIRISFDGERYALFLGGHEARVSHSSVLGGCVEAADLLSNVLIKGQRS